MTAPINTGDFWLRGKIVAPEVDPAYPYPASVQAMSPAPAVLFRLNDSDMSDGKHAVDLMGNQDFRYKRTHAQVDGFTCDCDYGTYNDIITLAKAVRNLHSEILLDHVTVLSMVMYAAVASFAEYNTLFHYGQLDTISGTKFGIQLKMNTGGRLLVVWNGGASAYTLNGHTFELMEEAIIGLSVNTNVADVYLNGSLLESVTLSPAMTAPSSFQGIGWGNSLSSTDVWNATNHRSSLYISEAMIWDSYINAAAHAFVAGQMLTECDPAYNCMEWHWDYDPDAVIPADPGEVQEGDFWIIED